MTGGQKLEGNYIPFCVFLNHMNKASTQNTQRKNFRREEILCVYFYRKFSLEIIHPNANNVYSD